MFSIAIGQDFARWRDTARRLLQTDVAPENVLLTVDEQTLTFDELQPTTDEGQRTTDKIIKVPADFIELANTAACVDDAEKWNLLYRILWRVTRENRHLLDIESDADVRQALLHVKAIRRDVHKFHAFVRFRRVEDERGENFVAWHEPAHFTVERAAPFFARRFGTMRFSILTPKNCAHWDLENLVFSEGVARENAPQPDALEDFWKTYYASIFNPARLKVKAMKAELPVRFWRNLPEAELIPDLIKSAEQRTRQMIENKANRAEVIRKLSTEDTERHGN